MEPDSPPPPYGEDVLCVRRLLTSHCVHSLGIATNDEIMYMWTTGCVHVSTASIVGTIE